MPTPSPRMRHDKAHRTGRIQEMFSGGPTQRIEPDSSSKRIWSRLCATYPYSLGPAAERPILRLFFDLLPFLFEKSLGCNCQFFQGLGDSILIFRYARD